jgi:hypothetical protein
VKYVDTSLLVYLIDDDKYMLQQTTNILEIEIKRN